MRFERRGAAGIAAFVTMAAVVGLLAGVPNAVAAEAKAKAAASTSKTCKFKLSTGKVKTWTCDKGQICCASEQFGLFTCGSQLLQCL